MRSAREQIVYGLRARDTKTQFGFHVHFGDDHANAFIRDGSGDRLDALLCAVQAAWAYSQRDSNFGIPVGCDPLEGWILDPSLTVRKE